MSFVKEAFEKKANIIIANLKKRNMEGYYCENSKELLETLLPMIEDGASIAWGGSESLKECGLMEAIKNGDYELIDRMTATTPEEQRQLFAKTSLSDYYLMSTNAITLNGELINIDGNGNRLASLIHGPAHVIIVAGMNKVVTDVESGYKRVKTTACPPNAVRLSRKTPCGATGKCGDCLSPDCFCNQIVITRRSGHVGRIKVVLIGEELGY
jgi:hypothetical protein